MGVDYVPAGVARHWKSTQWRLVSLVELAIPPDEPRAVAAANYVLNDILDRRHNGFGPKIVNGLPRICVNAEGAALVIGSRLGMAADPRVQGMAEALLDWQWPDGGWNCHRNASGRRSNFHESITAAWACTSTPRRQATPQPRPPPTGPPRCIWSTACSTAWAPVYPANTVHTLLRPAR